ncbi:hypothetical protein DCAR_0727984 [Daucus carota subsp. sativus]|uniref:VQ domain-containing protein n=1 Tax=Daucus carota subsp. sativus TaxID=79200 RepID=A0A164T5G1_DAUCS|nr:hypothetical protein DCAR_0727984 [Daucus carota subsp. sativus]
MNNHPNASTDHHQWLHYYNQQTPDAGYNPAVVTSVGGGGNGSGFSDTTSTIVTTSFTTNNTSSPSKSTSLGNTDVHLNPQASVGKPIRRRSRAPRKNPTTLLNASTTNFRSLVQQFTGCQNTKATSFGSRKGPVNLSFGLPRNMQNDHHIINTSSRIAPVGSEYFHDQLANPGGHDQKQGQQWQQQEMFEKLRINSTKNMQSGGLDDFGIDDMHGLINESSSFSSSVDKQDGNYYF